MSQNLNSSAATTQAVINDDDDYLEMNISMDSLSDPMFKNAPAKWHELFDELSGELETESSSFRRQASLYLYQVDHPDHRKTTPLPDNVKMFAGLKEYHQRLQKLVARAPGGMMRARITYAHPGEMKTESKSADKSTPPQSVVDENAPPAPLASFEMFPSQPSPEAAPQKPSSPEVAGRRPFDELPQAQSWSQTHVFAAAQQENQDIHLQQPSVQVSQPQPPAPPDFSTDVPSALPTQSVPQQQIFPGAPPLQPWSLTQTFSNAHMQRPQGAPQAQHHHFAPRAQVPTFQPQSQPEKFLLPQVDPAERLWESIQQILLALGFQAYLYIYILERNDASPVHMTYSDPTAYQVQLVFQQLVETMRMRGYGLHISISLLVPPRADLAYMYASSTPLPAPLPIPPRYSPMEPSSIRSFATRTDTDRIRSTLAEVASGSLHVGCLSNAGYELWRRNDPWSSFAFTQAYCY